MITGHPSCLIRSLVNHLMDSVIRRYEFTIARNFASPDGYRKKSILVNGQFPGPLIEANWYV